MDAASIKDGKRIEERAVNTYDKKRPQENVLLPDNGELEDAAAVTEKEENDPFLHKPMERLRETNRTVYNLLSVAMLHANFSITTMRKLLEELEKVGLEVVIKDSPEEAARKEEIAVNKFVTALTEGNFPRDAAIKVMRMAVDSGIKFTAS